jgi:outer membrane lipoprotein SlyB
MTTPKMVTVGLMSFVLVGCATSGANYRPLIDTKGVDLSKYESDLVACQAYARTQSGAGEGAAKGAAVGAAVGAVLAGVAGRDYDTGAAARVGGVTGAARGAQRANNDQEMVIKRCLQGRGYSVLK